MKKSLLAATVMAALCSTAHAATVTGTITDKNGSPLPGVTVHFHGKTVSVLTDKQGKFAIEIDSAGQLHISKSDYLDQRLTVSNKNQELSLALTPAAIESLVVYASALHKSNLEMTSPVTVLAGEELKRSTEATLGETLNSLPGVSSTYFGPVASSPIIRGLDGPRVKILQNGLDASDASRIGADHVVTTESLTANQIEILKGPATLLYGSGAIGGVVNVVDDRIPLQNFESTSLDTDIRFDTVSNGKTAVISLNSGDQGFNFHFDGLLRDSEDYSVPSFFIPEDEHHEEDEHEEEGHEDAHDEENTGPTTTIENTFIETENFNIGGSWLSDHFVLGASLGKISTDYGIPGHDHGHGHEEEHDDEEEGHNEEEAVFATLDQTRWQGIAKWITHGEVLESITAQFSYTDYQHNEVEDGEAGTTFSNDSFESRLAFEHTLSNWHGVFGYHFLRSDYGAAGEEAFTPDSVTETHAIYLLEERQWGEFSLELGARYEQVNIFSNQIPAHEHEEEHEEDHDDEHGEAEYIAFDEDTNNLSLSAGINWQFAPEYIASISLSHSERGASAAELLSNGLHIATGTYDLGAGYHIEEDGEFVFENTETPQEKSNNIDLTFKKIEGDFGFALNLYYNDISNFYFQQDTGLFFNNEHGHDHEEQHDDEGHEDEGHEEEEEGSRIFQYRYADAEIYGVELDAHYKLSERSELNLFADSVQAKLDTDQYLPRIPQNKLGLRYQYELAQASFGMTATHYFEQNNLSAFETVTPSYTLVDLSFNYQFEMGKNELTMYANVKNLTDELAFAHTSFIKELAPRPGRNFSFGIRGHF